MMRTLTSMAFFTARLPESPARRFKATRLELDQMAV